MGLIGIPIGFYGYVFPGNINLMVLELYNSKKYKFLLYMLLLIVTFESIYCVLTLQFLNNIQHNSKFYVYMEAASYGLILIMGLWMLFENKENKYKSHQNTILRGVLSIIIHPQQIPFWLITGILVNRWVGFSLKNGAFIAFVLFNAMGTILAMIGYMIYGRKIMNYFKLNIAFVNKVLGGLYILLVLYHLLPV